MIYLSGFRFPGAAQEANYMANSWRAKQTCYDSYYPFGLFEGRTLPELDMLEITILYGGNGSGKTTLLNVMADALRLHRGQSTTARRSLTITCACVSRAQCARCRQAA